MCHGHDECIDSSPGSSMFEGIPASWLWSELQSQWHINRECALPAVLRHVSLPAEGGRADIALASSQAVCVSFDQYIATGVMHDQGRGCFGDTQCPELAEPALVPGPDRAAGGATLPDPSQEGSAISQVSGLVWHPNPKLWSLHVWLL